MDDVIVAATIAAMTATLSGSCWLSLASGRGAGRARPDGRKARLARSLLAGCGYGFLVYALLSWWAVMGWETGIPFFLAMVMVASVLAVFLKGSRPELLRPIGALAAISALAAGLIIARQIWG
ncbi:MAG: hypothetical protein MI824_13905 [Hyphomicrobiales bacterium]|nr:hypothetical protein [Hyphomicrobiales bacterium]